MKCVVTGGAGFIGSHLVDLLLQCGNEVTVIDNFATGRIENLADAQERFTINIIKEDIANFERISPHFTGADWVFHLAALADIVPSIQHPLAYHRANVDGTVSVLEASRKAGVSKFVYAASSSCYGIPETFPTPESAPAKPMYPYALTKYLGEQCCMHWSQVYNLPVVSLRFFNVYGPRSRTSGTYGAVFGVFLAQKIHGKPFTVVGDGSQTRDFTYVSDIANALLSAASADVRGEVFNVGSGNTYSINLLTDLLKGEKIYIPKRPGEPDCTFASIEKIQKLLSWHPKISLEEGVSRLLKSIHLWTNAPVWTAESINDATKEWFQYLGEKK